MFFKKSFLGSSLFVILFALLLSSQSGAASNQSYCKTPSLRGTVIGHLRDQIGKAPNFNTDTSLGKSYQKFLSGLEGELLENYYSDAGKWKLLLFSETAQYIRSEDRHEESCEFMVSIPALVRFSGGATLGGEGASFNVLVSLTDQGSVGAHELTIGKKH